MKKAALIIGLMVFLVGGSLLQPVAGQVLPYEIRCYLERYQAGPPSLADLTWQRSNILKRYACPKCGFSSDVAGTCPDLWGVDGGAGTTLVDMGTSRDRIVSMPPWDMPTGQSDLLWYDYTAGAVFRRAVIGLPFHPATRTLDGTDIFRPADHDPRGYGLYVYPRAAISLPFTFGDGTTVIPQAAIFRFVIMQPGVGPWDGTMTGVARVTAPLTPDGATGFLEGRTLPLAQLQLPEDNYGVGRIYLEWSNDGGATWITHGADAGGNDQYLNAAFYCSRLQVPPAGQSPGPGEQGRNGGGPGTPGPVERPNSHLARILIAPLVAGFRNDLYMPGATTPRRYFTLVNRGNDRMVENLAYTALENLATAPGMRAAGRTAVRPGLPTSAVLMGPSGSGANSVPAKALDTRHWVQAKLPAYQPASEPGDTLDHTPDNNWGYRGLQLVYSDANSDQVWNSNLSPGMNSAGDRVEEFCPFDLQVSVDRAARLMADTGATEPGRVAPGVFSTAPDTTVGAPPAGRFAYPGNVALTDSFIVSNEGNVVSPVRLLSTNQATAEPVGVSPKYRSLGRYLAGNPVWLPLAAYTALRTASLPPGWSGSAGGWATAGVAGLGNANNPLPLGQGSGQYAGQVVYFLDLNGNGQLDFIDRMTGTATTTGTSYFDARQDEPLEPVTYVPTGVRVTESRLPFNDYYAADTEPALRFDYGNNATRLQVMWVSNRYSVALGDGSVDVAAPATTGPTQAAQPHYPGNVLYGNANWSLVAGVPDYRPYFWDWATGSRNVTGTTAAASPGSVNGAPETFNDLSDNHWALWHQSLQSSAGVISTLRYKGSTGAGWPGADSFIYATGRPKQGIRGFALQDPANPTNPLLWLFWTEGDQGHQTLHYRWNWKGTADNQEAPVPVSNVATADWRSDVINDFASAAPMRKPSTTPFVYTKDPAAFLWTDPRTAGGVGPQVHVVFSGYTARQQNEDICWAAFDQANMSNQAQNYGKLTFPRVVNNPVLPPTAWGGGGNVTARAGEQLVGDGLRQVFSSRHLDWLISPTFETAGLGARDARDPRLYLGLVFSSAPNTPYLYSVSWGSGKYSRARGVYTVTPVFAPLGGAPALPAAVQTAAGSGILRNPLAPTGAGTVPIPVTMQIEPSTGTVTFAQGLFNTANPRDTGAVFNRTIGGLDNLVNVVLYADYTPFIFRVTTSDAADDSPNAFAEVDSNDPNQLRLVFLWRRTYSQKDTPSFGRTDFLYKTWTLGTQVAAPPLASAPAVAAWTGSGWTAPLTAGQTGDYTYNPVSGIITMTADGYRGGSTPGVFWLRSAYDGARIRIGYNGGLVEEHRVMGWSQETTAPVDTVQNEGPLRAVPEIYSVSAGGGNLMPAVRYWLVWSSPRAVYDLRLAGNNGSVLQQSSDVYLGTIVPRYGAALREQEVEWQNVQQ